MKTITKLLTVSAIALLSSYQLSAQVVVGPSGTGIYWDWTGRTIEQYTPDGGASQVIRFKNSMSSSTGNPNGGFDFAWHNGVSILRIIDGKVGIGTTTPDAKLAVKGTIHAQEVKVDLDGALVPDYVFETNYKLLPIGELAAFLNQYKHLPEIPSAKEMDKDGMNLKEMNLLLLKKVEELTLYVIEQQKQIDALKEKIK